MDDKQKPRSIRALESRSIRTLAAEIAFNRGDPNHSPNGDEKLHGQGKHYPMSFTKGLEHDETTGLVTTPADFEAFREAINSGKVADFNKAAVNGPKRWAPNGRKWEAPTAGFVFDLEGPDAQAVTMPPAPGLGDSTNPSFDELAFEMAEVYELALLRDVSFSDFKTNGDVKSSCDRLNKLPYNGGFRERPSGAPKLAPDNIFRGIGNGVLDGPYISQFLLIGNAAFGNKVECGIIRYGAQAINQRVPQAAQKDFMTAWDEWRAVQDGIDVNEGNDTHGQIFVSKGGHLIDRDNLVNDDGKWIDDDGKLSDNPVPSKPNRRFISTPRDLATYVHFDQLYQAYLNAALILLSMKAPFDPAFAPLHGQGMDTNVEGFALYGGPHILTLVTEVATRALKAVRYQKFNNHLRLRPEALAARIEKATTIGGLFPQFFADVDSGQVGGVGTVGAIRAKTGNALLPMAFREGSPMHPSYGAGHATVAGACVTVLKAFFDTSTVLGKDNQKGVGFWPNGGDSPVYYQVNEGGDPSKNCAPYKCLSEMDDKSLTLEGELNKLAANISIGRNMAGVHYYSDYYDSLLMGEEIAIGILEEQSLCYTKDPFAMSLRKFDGTGIRINIKGD